MLEVLHFIFRIPMQALMGIRGHWREEHKAIIVVVSVATKGPNMAFKGKGSISWTVHVRAEAQNLKNSAEYFKIDPAKKGWRPQVAEAAVAVNEGTRVAKKRFLTWNSVKESALKTLNVLSSKIIYFSRGLQRNSRQDVNVLVAAISRHVRYLLNIGEGKSCFPCLMI